MCQNIAASEPKIIPLTIITSILIATLIGISLSIHSVHQRAIKPIIATTSGRVLSGFFDGLPPNAKVSDILRRPSVQQKGCGQKRQGMVERALTAVGFGTTVHAQTGCYLTRCYSCNISLVYAQCSGAACGSGTWAAGQVPGPIFFWGGGRPECPLAVRRKTDTRVIKPSTLAMVAMMENNADGPKECNPFS